MIPIANHARNPSPRPPWHSQTYGGRNDDTATLSRRTLVASAVALPALAVPAAADPSPTAPTTLPPDLIERLERVRAWYLDYRRREEAHGNEVYRRFYAATGVTEEQYREMNYGHPRRKELDPIHTKICNELRLLRTTKLRATSFVRSDGVSPWLL
jgi:hypothetical protein